MTGPVPFILEEESITSYDWGGAGLLLPIITISREGDGDEDNHGFNYFAVVSYIEATWNSCREGAVVYKAGSTRGTPPVGRLQEDGKLRSCDPAGTDSDSSGSSNPSLDSFTEADIRACNHSRSCHCPRSHPDSYAGYVEEKRRWKRLAKKNRWLQLFVTYDFLRKERTVQMLPRFADYKYSELGTPRPQILLPAARDGFSKET